MSVEVDNNAVGVVVSAVVVAAAPVVGEDDGLVEVAVGLVGEDVERHLRPLLLDVLDEDSDLHRTANLNMVRLWYGLSPFKYF